MYTEQMSRTEQAFTVTGMSCSACSARVERAVGQLPGIESVQVNLLTGIMRVIFTAEQTPESICATVRAIGYGISSVEKRIPISHENTALKRRFLLSLALLLPLMLLHHVWHGQLSALVQLVFTLIITWLNRAFFINGTASVLKGAANMNTLVALGAGAAIADGIFNFWFQHRGSYYFESAAMILTLITFGKWLESRATGRTGRTLEKLLSLLPQNASVLRGDSIISIPADAVQPGDTLLIRAGERVPTDGTVTEGISTADESALTGESLPAEKSPGSKVYAGTINNNGTLKVRADKSRAESTLSGIIHLVGEAAAGKAPISRLADRISGIFVPVVVLLALLTCGIWIFCGESAAFAISCSIAVLVISCPCALGLATPVAIMVGTGRGAESGILYRSGADVENLQRTQCVVLDKTGTITEGKPAVTDVLPAASLSAAELLQIATALESGSNHPLASAICSAASSAPTLELTHQQYLPGKGIVAEIGGIRHAAGNAHLMQELGIPADFSTATALSEQGKTALFFARGSEYIGLIAVADRVKQDSIMAIAAMKKLGLQVCMLTGDAEATAQAIAKQVGITDFQASLLPQQKVDYIKTLQQDGKHVCMIGDGTNDAPALMQANTGMAIGAGTDIALESAGIILVSNRLSDAVQALQLSRAVVANIRQNFFWALLYNSLAIPLAAGVFYPLFGLLLHPAIAAAAMGMSSFCVVTNALRLNRFKAKQLITMNTITIKVDGMMCPHCEAHVTKALLGIPGVVDCKADHKAKHVTVTLYPEVSVAELHATIRAQGYTVIG